MSAISRSARHAASTTRWRRPGGVVIIALAVVIGMAASGVFVWHASYAAFSSTTSNGANSWTAGTVTLSDDDTSSLLFDASGLKPGSTATNCITVTYSGNLATAGVKLYIKSGDLTEGGSGPDYLSDYLTMKVEEGTGGSFGSCTGFTPDVAVGNPIINNVHLSDIATNNKDYASGAGLWAPSAAGSKVYRFTYTLDSGAPSTVAGLTDTATFTWESQNS